MFTDHAVLQRDMPVPVWGSADPGEEVTVTIAGQTHKTKADDKGKWRVTLEPLKVGEPLTLVVEGKNRVERNDILVGEVWLCSGQSNMELAAQLGQQRRPGSLGRQSSEHSPRASQRTWQPNAGRRFQRRMESLHAEIRRRLLGRRLFLRPRAATNNSMCRSA